MNETKMGRKVKQEKWGRGKKVSRDPGSTIILQSKSKDVNSVQTLCNRSFGQRSSGNLNRVYSSKFDCKALPEGPRGPFYKLSSKPVQAAARALLLRLLPRRNKSWQKILPPFMH